MRRFVSIILIICMTLLGSGVVQYLHNLTHVRDELASAQRQEGDSPKHSDHHRSTPHNHDCDICVQFQQPVTSVHAASIDFGAGELIGLVNFESLCAASALALERIDCRGPPPARVFFTLV